VREVAGSNPVVPTTSSSLAIARKRGRNSVTLIELLFFLFAIFLSFVFGKYFFRHVGWWGAVSAAVLGFSVVIGLIVALNWMLPSQTEKAQRKVPDTE
jgi:Na+/proline symporter